MAPAITADQRGRVLLTWLDTTGPKAAIRFSSFDAAAPGGNILTVTDSLDAPLSPSIASAPNGHAWIAWSDHGTGEYLTCFARYSPDSGLRPRLRLSNSTFPQPSVDVAADTNGTAYFAWQQVTSGVSEIHLLRRDPGWLPPMPDTVLYASSQSLQDPALAVDLMQGVHLAFTRSGGLGQQVEYMRAYAGRDWDAYPTDVSDPAQGSAGHVALLPFTHGNTTILYTDDNGTTVHEHARARRLDPPLALSVPPRVTLGAGFRIGPNPLLAGEELYATGTALARAGGMDLFDAAGRRVATAPVNAGAARFTPSADSCARAGALLRPRRGGAAVRWWCSAEGVARPAGHRARDRNADPGGRRARRWIPTWTGIGRPRASGGCRSVRPSCSAFRAPRTSPRSGEPRCRAHPPPRHAPGRRPGQRPVRRPVRAAASGLVALSPTTATTATATAATW